MILAIGEILVDKIVENGVEKNFLGGAAVNMIVNAKQQGANASFVGRVGSDENGKFLIEQMKKANLDKLDIQVDSERATTIALVTLDNGERDFKFIRNDTADYHVDVSAIDFGSYENLQTIHLSSLMLSEKEGVAFANEVVNKAKELGVRLSFDVNFRADTYDSQEIAVKTYLPFIKSADIVKFSEEELELFTGEKDLVKSCKTLCRKGQLFLITLGSKGSTYYLDGETGFAPTVPVKPVDTTGAGDAFFGTFNACIEGKPFTKENLLSAMEKANEIGAKTTQFYGAVKV
ncbi:MAG: carbohydrate kinase [Clostridia bacterium]|nr:carbohydrate kinase [Clostridia bacterium]